MSRDSRSSTLDAVRACLARIEARDAAVLAWAHLDAVGALTAAAASDAEPGAKPLVGVTLGIKDVIDVRGMPTGHGSPIFADNLADADADAVALLRAAGAIVLGKTVTAEFATYSPGATVNPRRAGHTPGGSSSGSAAAVADGQVDVALGTQTAGSVIRPASFCGLLGFKPSYGRYSLGGVLTTAPSLDTLGVFGRSLDHIARVDSVLAGDAELPVTGGLPVIGVCTAYAGSAAQPEMLDALAAFVAILRAAGFEIIERDLPPDFPALVAAQALIHRHEASVALGHIRHAHPDRVSAVFRDFIDQGARETAGDYAAAKAIQRRWKEQGGVMFAGVDLLLTPGAIGSAPAGLGATGDPVFQRPWTALGVPCLGFPAAWNAAGLPLGLQLVGPPGGDHALLAHAAEIIPHGACGQE